VAGRLLGLGRWHAAGRIALVGSAAGSPHRNRPARCARCARRPPRAPFRLRRTSCRSVGVSPSLAPMEAALIILAVLGFVAALVRFIRAAFGALRHGVDAYLAGEAVEARARRGDLTGMAEAQTWR